jgi:hypothetical protein
MRVRLLTSEFNLLVRTAAPAKHQCCQDQESRGDAEQGCRGTLKKHNLSVKTESLVSPNWSIGGSSFDLAATG